MSASHVPMSDRLREDLGKAMKSKDRALTRVLRSMISALDNAEAAEEPTSTTGSVGFGDVPRRELEPNREIEVIEAEILERETGMVEYQRAGQLDAAAVLRAEILILRRYLE